MPSMSQCKEIPKRDSKANRKRDRFLICVVMITLSGCNSATGGTNSGACVVCEECNCPQGEHSPGCGGPNGGECEACPDNTFKADGGPGFCVECASCSAGFYRDGCGVSSGGSCKPCLNNTFKVSDGSERCDVCASCPAGQHREGCGSSDPGICARCICEVGQYSVGCGGSSRGTCLECDECEWGQVRFGCDGYSSGSCEVAVTVTYTARLLMGLDDFEDQVGQYKRSVANIFRVKPQSVSIDDVRLSGSLQLSFIEVDTSVVTTEEQTRTVAVDPITVINIAEAFGLTLTEVEGICVGCPLGKQRDLCTVPTTVDCAACPSRTFKATLGAERCMPCNCPQGEHSLDCGGPNGGECEACPDNTFKADGGPGFCVECASCSAGFYRDGCGVSSGGSCKPCLNNTFKVSDGSERCDVCASCPAGQHREGCGGAQGGSCVDCPPVTFKVSFGTDVCTRCICEVGQYSVGCGGSSRGTCLECDECEWGQVRFGCDGYSSGSCEVAVTVTYTARLLMGLDDFEDQVGQYKRSVANIFRVTPKWVTIDVHLLSIRRTMQSLAVDTSVVTTEDQARRVTTKGVLEGFHKEGFIGAEMLTATSMQQTFFPPGLRAIGSIAPITKIADGESFEFHFDLKTYFSFSWEEKPVFRLMETDTWLQVKFEENAVLIGGVAALQHEGETVVRIEAVSGQQLASQTFKLTIQAPGTEADPWYKTRTGISVITTLMTACVLPFVGWAIRRTAIRSRPERVASSRPRILAVFAQDRADRLQLNGEAQELEGIIGQRRLLECSLHVEPTFKRFHEALMYALRDNTRIVHLAGHGDKQKGFYFLKDETGSGCEAFDSKVIAEALRNSSGNLDCIVLNACETEEMGRDLIRRGMKLVVCWRSKVDDSAAVAFSKTFYTSLLHLIEEKGVLIPTSSMYLQAFRDGRIQVQSRQLPAASSANSDRARTEVINEDCRGRPDDQRTRNCVVLLPVSDDEDVDRSSLGMGEGERNVPKESEQKSKGSMGPGSEDRKDRDATYHNIDFVVEVEGQSEEICEEDWNSKQGEMSADEMELETGKETEQKRLDENEEGMEEEAEGQRSVKEKEMFEVD